jgi:hypothetical protein
MTDGHGKTVIRLMLVGPDESAPALFSRDGVIGFGDPRMVAELNFIITNIVFAQPGEYRLQIFGNEELLMERRLYVAGPPPGAMPPSE